jgi:hypothetical protein
MCSVADATVAASATIVRAHGCAVLPQTDANDPSSVRFDTTALLGNLSCGADAGEVEQLSARVTLDGGAEPATVEADCGSDLIFDGAKGRQSVRAYVTALQGGNVFAGALCQAVTVPGASVLASCARLTTTGTLRVDLADALTQLGVGCDSSISEVRVKPVQDGATEQRFLPPRCLQPFDSDFAVGPASITVTAYQGAEPLGSLNCHNEVEPGGLVSAICEAP